MNQDKAREFFSAYYEGTLEAGLTQQLEARMRADAQLSADYAAFVETMSALDDLRFEEIEVPLYLNDRIATRLEHEEAKRRQPVFAWTHWFRGLAFSGLAAAALMAAFVAIRSDGGPATASLVPGQSETTAVPAGRLAFSAQGRNVQVQYRAEAEGSVVVSTATTGQELGRYPLNGNELRAPLTNSHAAPAVLRVAATGDAGAVVVLPGTEKQAAKNGAGSLQAFAAALAGHYGVPVVVRGTSSRDVEWNFETASPLRAAQAALGSEVSVDQRDSGLVTILAN